MLSAMETRKCTRRDDATELEVSGEREHYLQGENNNPYIYYSSAPNYSD